MVGFRIVRDDRDKGSLALPTSGIVVTVGDLLEQLEDEATTWTLVTTGSFCTSRKAIATQTVAATATEVNGVLLDGTELIEVGSANSSAVTDNGNGMIIGTATTGAMTINNTHTTVATNQDAQIFLQYGVVGAATDKRILGWVMVGNGPIHAAA